MTQNETVPKPGIKMGFGTVFCFKSRFKIKVSKIAMEHAYKITRYFADNGNYLQMKLSENFRRFISFFEIYLKYVQRLFQ